jgi:hypothetical protein
MSTIGLETNIFFEILQTPAQKCEMLLFFTLKIFDKNKIIFIQNPSNIYKQTSITIPNPSKLTHINHKIS